MKEEKRPMWTFPWRYKESIAIVTGVLLVGLMLQLTIGNFNFYMLHFPVNIVVGLLLIAIIVAISFKKDSKAVRWISSIPLTVTLLGAVLLLTLVMGLTPQLVRVDPDIHQQCEHTTSFSQTLSHLGTKMGFKQMTSSWSFVLIYSFLLLVLGVVVAKRVRKFSWSDIGFYLNHLGLWILLFAAGLGAADMLRYVMYVEVGETEWRVFDRAGEEMLELDIAIQLHEFIMEEYEPKLAVIDKYTGDVQPVGRPRFYQIDQKRPTSHLAGWDVTLMDYIHEAVRKTDTTFQAIPMRGSMPAAKVRAVNMESGRSVEGWVTCGSVDQFVMPLDLDSLYSIVMTKPEAKRFASDITVIMKDDKVAPVRTTLEVNSPLRMGGWMIYQYDYDHALGKASQVSGLELVYDPWLRVVYVGIALLGVGSVLMVWFGKRSKKR